SGHHLHALAHNRDPRPVETGRRRRSIGSQRAFGFAPKTPADIDAIVVTLVDRVTRRMRAAGRVRRTVVLPLRFRHFTRAARSHTMSRSTAHTRTILTVMRALLAEAQPIIAEKGLTLVGLSVSNLDNDDAVQLALPIDAGSTIDLDIAVDDVRDK